MATFIVNNTQSYRPDGPISARNSDFLGLRDQKKALSIRREFGATLKAVWMISKLKLCEYFKSFPTSLSKYHLISSCLNSTSEKRKLQLRSTYLKIMKSDMEMGFSLCTETMAAWLFNYLNCFLMADEPF